MGEHTRLVLARKTVLTPWAVWSDGKATLPGIGSAVQFVAGSLPALSEMLLLDESRLPAKDRYRPLQTFDMSQAFAKTLILCGKLTAIMV